MALSLDKLAHDQGADQEEVPDIFAAGLGGNLDIGKRLKDRNYADCKFKFDGKNVLMTGASSGIGRETAKKLLRSGANVAMLGRNVSAMEELTSDSKKLGEAYIKELDLNSDPENVQSVFNECMSDFGDKLDVLIN